MYTISYDPSKNRIFIKIIGTMTDQEVQDYTKETISLIDTANPGFTVCANMEQSDRTVLENSGTFQGIRDYAMQKQLRNVATVLSQEAYNIHQEAPFTGIRNIFLNQEEAERFLDT